MRFDRIEDRGHIPKSRELSCSLRFKLEGRSTGPFCGGIAQDALIACHHQPRCTIDRRAVSHELTSAHASDEPKERFAGGYADGGRQSKLLNRLIDDMRCIDCAACIVAMKATASAECGREDEALVIIEQISDRPTARPHDFLQ